MEILLVFGAVILVWTILSAIFQSDGKKRSDTTQKYARESSGQRGMQGRGKQYELAQWKAGLTVKWSGKGQNFQIDYKDSKGKRSRRCVLVDKIFKSENGEYYFSGHDDLDKDNRTFKLSRVSDDVIRISTGEIINMRDWVRKRAQG